MAVWSTTKTIGENVYGNVGMKINIYRGECTRTENAVSFKFGVIFKPDGKWTSNSIYRPRKDPKGACARACRLR